MGLCSDGKRTAAKNTEEGAYIRDEEKEEGEDNGYSRAQLEGGKKGYKKKKIHRQRERYKSQALSTSERSDRKQCCYTHTPGNILYSYRNQS